MFALEWAEGLIVESFANIAASAKVYSSLDQTGNWIISTRDANSKLAHAKALVHDIRTQLFNTAVEGTQHHASIVDNHAPSYAHYINDGMFSHALATRHLTLATSKYDIGNDTVALYHCTTQLGALSAKFSIEDTRQSPTSNEALHDAEVVLRVARNALTIVAAVKCCLNHSGGEHKRAAINMLTPNQRQLQKSRIG